MTGSDLCFRTTTQGSVEHGLEEVRQIRKNKEKAP